MVRPRAFAGVKGRVERQRARKGIILRDVGISARTQERYYEAVRQLLPHVERCKDMEAMDETISDWIEDSFRKGLSLNTIGNALSGLHYFMPSTKRRLPSSWKLFGTWRRFETPSRAPPITGDLIWAMAGKALSEGDFSLGSLLLLGFHCFLRTGELLAVRPCDLLLGHETGIVTLPTSKGQTRHHMVESVTIEDCNLLVVLSELLKLKQEQRLMKVPIWVSSGSAFREAFYRLCRFFKVEHLQFRCYSLRRGGATSYFKECGLMERTLLRGRWASIAVARLYLCDALSQLPHLTASKESKRLIARYRAFWSTR